MNQQRSTMAAVTSSALGQKIVELARLAALLDLSRSAASPVDEDIEVASAELELDEAGVVVLGTGSDA